MSKTQVLPGGLLVRPLCPADAPAGFLRSLPLLYFKLKVSRALVARLPAGPGGLSARHLCRLGSGISASFCRTPICRVPLHPRPHFT